MGWQTGASCVNAVGSFTCICNAGYTNAAGGQCVGCERGSYKAVNGSSECVLCGVDTYLNVSAGTACLDCPAGRYLDSMGGTACLDVDECVEEALHDCHVRALRCWGCDGCGEACGKDGLRQAKGSCRSSFSNYDESD